MTAARPIREKGEAFDAYLQRLEAWAKSPDGLSFDAAVAAARAKEQAAVRAQQQAEIVDRSGIPLRYSRAFEEAIPDRPTEATVALHGDRLLLVLAGKAGCGKTYAAARWLWDFIHAEVTPRRWPRFVPAGDLPRMNEHDLFTVRAVSRLVIDDLGMEYADDKGFFATTLDRLLDWRYANLSPTVITTNLRAETFRARYGERIADRIREAGAFVEISNESLRGSR